jgi:DNA-binding NarL/FixJ family response regulator
VTAEKSVKVLLVDDHAVVRAGYRTLLQDAPELEIVGEAENGEVAVREYGRLEPDVVVMDITLPGMGGLEAIRRICARDSNARVLVFSMHEDPIFVEQALAAGAQGYLTKSSAPERLIEAVKTIARGGIQVDPDIAQRLAFQKSRGRGSPFVALSSREFEIFALIAEGVSIAEIARRLSLSYKTVANYGTQIKLKLDVATNAELARLAIRHGVVKA